MKKFILLTIALLSVSLVVWAQDPVDTIHVEPATAMKAPPLDSFLFVSFPTGSVPYPSEEASYLLSKVAKPVPQDFGPEKDPFAGHYFGMRRYDDVVKRHQPRTDRALCEGAQILIGFTFYFLGNFDSNFEVGYYHLNYWP